MRPRVFPAEDGGGSAFLQPPLHRFNEAAGIPRGRPVVRRESSGRLLASMRPRVFPAEDAASIAPLIRCQPCFNEAAGIPRGRRPAARGAAPGHHRFNEAAGIPRGRRASGALIEVGVDLASMRPRVFPAEDVVLLFASFSSIIALQ